MKTIKTTGKQTLLDLAMQHYGNIEAISEIMELNPGLKNNPEAVAEYYDRIAEAKSLFPEIELLTGQDVIIDDSSDLMKKNVTKMINNPVTTYDNGKENKAN